MFFYLPSCDNTAALTDKNHEAEEKSCENEETSQELYHLYRER